MRRLILIALLMLNSYHLISQVETSEGLMDGYLHVTLYEEKKGLLVGRVDNGQPYFPYIMNGDKTRDFYSPVDLIRFMQSNGFIYIGTEMYTIKGEIYTVWKFRQ